MSSFHKKNPLIHKIISSKEFKVDIPEMTRRNFAISAIEEEDIFDTYGTAAVLEDSLDISEECPVFLISSTVKKAASQIDLKKVQHVFDLNKMPFQRGVLLLGSDADGMYYLQNHPLRDNVFLSFTFLHGTNFEEIIKNKQTGNIVTSPMQFVHSKEHDAKYESTVLLAQLLVYMTYGDITTKKYGKKEDIKTNTRGTIKNTTDYNVTYVNTLWRQRVNTVGFLVTGHWRLQPYGPRDNSEHKLIWIEEFEKSGYNRKATKELL